MALNDQISFANTGFERYAKTTKRAAFLNEMDRITPWKDPCNVIVPFYCKRKAGRPPLELERMLRIHFLQQWLNLSDPAAEEALYDVLSMRAVVGIDLGNAAVPDEGADSGTFSKSITWARNSLKPSTISCARTASRLLAA